MKRRSFIKTSSGVALFFTAGAATATANLEDPSGNPATGACDPPVSTSPPKPGKVYKAIPTKHNCPAGYTGIQWQDFCHTTEGPGGVPYNYFMVKCKKTHWYAPATWITCGATFPC